MVPGIVTVTASYNHVAHIGLAELAQKGWIMPSAPIKMTAEAVASRLEEDYSSGSPYQWSIEWLRNVWVKPTATEAFIRILDLPGNGVRVVMIDNGAHIPEDELYEYIATLGAGAGDLWRLDNMEGNRHAGLRASILPWADLTVATWDDVLLPDGSEIELFYDGDTSTYSASDVVALDPEVLAALRKEVSAYDGTNKRGVAFILCDRDESKDGPFSDARKGESTAGVADALRDRVFSVNNQDTGDPIRIVAEVPIFGTDVAKRKKGPGGGAVVTIDGKPTTLDSRTIKGFEPWVTRSTPAALTAVTGDPIVLDEHGTVCRWWLLPECDENRRVMRGGRGFVAIRYKNELLPLSDNVQTDFRRFGIILSAVYDRLAIIIEPPTSGPGWHVKQNASRSRIESFNGMALPVDEWAETFVDQIPAAIRDANAAARSRGVGSSSAHLARVMEKFSERFKVLVATRRRKPGTGVIGDVNAAVAPSDAGDEVRLDRKGGEGTTTVVKPHANSGGRTSGPATVNRPNTGTSGEASVFRSAPRRRRARDVQAEVAVDEKPYGLEPEYLSGAEWADRFTAIEVAGYAYLWDRAGGFLVINVDHPVHTLAIDYYTGAWLDVRPNVRRRTTTEEIRDAVLEAYFLDALTGIAAAVKLHGGEGKAHVEMTPEVMTKAHYNVAALDALIEPWLGSLGSSRRAIVAV